MNKTMFSNIRGSHEFKRGEKKKNKHSGQSLFRISLIHPQVHRVCPVSFGNLIRVPACLVESFSHIDGSRIIYAERE